MCGSGTLPIEAALAARRIPPGLPRTFAVERWPRRAPDLARAVRSELGASSLVPLPERFSGATAMRGHRERARQRRTRLGGDGPPARRARDLRDAAARVRPGVDRDESSLWRPRRRQRAVRDLWAQLGNVLRRQAPGWRLTLLSPDVALERQLQDPAARRGPNDERGNPGPDRERLGAARLERSPETRVGSGGWAVYGLGTPVIPRPLQSPPTPHPRPNAPTRSQGDAVTRTYKYLLVCDGAHFLEEVSAPDSGIALARADIRVPPSSACLLNGPATRAYLILPLGAAVPRSHRDSTVAFSVPSFHRC